jgi:hypothetical protein
MGFDQGMETRRARRQTLPRVPGHGDAKGGGPTRGDDAKEVEEGQRTWTGQHKTQIPEPQSPFYSWEKQGPEEGTGP